MLKLKFTKEMLELYLVSDRHWLEQRLLEEDIEKAIQGGVTIVQLREKNLDEQNFITEAKKIKQLCAKYQIPFIINDNLNVALAVDSDGIHIGQDDLPVNFVRDKIGPNKILGVSVHNLNEAKKAESDGADYLGVGAVFSTTTKNDASNVTSKELLDITTNVDLPVVAIGGINQNNCLQLKGSKINGIAVVSAIMAAANIKKATQELKQLARDIYD